MTSLKIKRWISILIATLGLGAILGLAGWLGIVDKLAVYAAPASTAASAYDWLQFNFDPQHSGNDTRETIITSSNAGTLHRLFQATLSDVADGSPVYQSAVSTPAGTRDLVLVTTRSGDIVALDAHTGSQAWSQHNPAGSCRINQGSAACYTTSSPAIDPNRQYVYSYGLDGKVHKYRVGDGSEIVDSHWPEVATLKGFDEKGSSALDTVTTPDGTSYLYMASGGYPGDQGDYQGHVTAINLTDGSQRIFNANCSDQTVHFVTAPGSPDCSAVQSAVWSRAAVVYDTNTGKIYLATGNGPYDPAHHDWGDSVLALNPNGTGGSGNPLDTFTPANFQQLADSDADLGSTAPAILPAPANSSVHHLAVQGGKDAKLRLLNLDNLSGQGGPGHTGGEVGTVINVPQGGEVLTAPAVWTSPADGSVWVFVANSNGISGLRLRVDGNGTPSLQAIWQKSNGGTSPIVANGVLYYAGNNTIRALNPVNGNPLWSGSIGSIHWESPIVANGVLYITDGNGKLNAYGPVVPQGPVHFSYLPVIFR